MNAQHASLKGMKKEQLGVLNGRDHFYRDYCIRTWDKGGNKLHWCIVHSVIGNRTTTEKAFHEQLFLNFATEKK